MSALGGSFPGWRVLDLFAGSGALGLECLSRGAAHATFVERARASVKVLERNIELVGAGDRATVVHGDALAWLHRHDSSEPLPEVALADPPYDEGFAAQLLEAWLHRPFARELWLEHATGESLPEHPALSHRRYGDTTLSHISLSDLDTNP